MDPTIKNPWARLSRPTLHWIIRQTKTRPIGVNVTSQYPKQLAETGKELEERDAASSSSNLATAQSTQVYPGAQLEGGTAAKRRQPTAMTLAAAEEEQQSRRNCIGGNSSKQQQQQRQRENLRETVWRRRQGATAC